MIPNKIFNTKMKTYKPLHSYPSYLLAMGPVKVRNPC